MSATPSSAPWGQHPLALRAPRAAARPCHVVHEHRPTYSTPPPQTHPQFDADSARSRLNLVYMLLSFYCLMPYISMGLYTSDKKFYLADASSQLYRPLAYYFAKVGSGGEGRQGGGGRQPGGGRAQRAFPTARRLAAGRWPGGPRRAPPAPKARPLWTHIAPPPQKNPGLGHHALPDRVGLRVWLHRVRHGRAAAGVRGDPEVRRHQHADVPDRLPGGLAFGD
jgi:hypothetical protein